MLYITETRFKDFLRPVIIISTWDFRIPQTCVGTIVCGHNRVWAQSCVGTIMYGPNRGGTILNTSPNFVDTVTSMPRTKHRFCTRRIH